MTEKRDFIAICSFAPGGGGSYGRGPSTHDAVSMCKKGLEQDWKHLFQLDGVEAKISVFEITGHDKVYWDVYGVHPEDQPKVSIPLYHVATAILSVPSQRKKKAKAGAKA